MKKITFITLSLFCLNAIKAQITIHSSDMPNAGDSVLVSITNSTAGIDHTLTGANYNWDYSTLTYNSQQEVKFDNPFTFPTVFAVLFNVLNTSYGRENRNLTSLPIPGVTLSAAYDFLKESTSSLKQVGAGLTINAVPIPFYYSPNDFIYRFPMDYLNTDSCDYSYILTIPTIGDYGETGHRVNMVDGWGTLITPSATYQTLRVKSVITSVDTLYISAFSLGSNIPRPIRVEYKWLATAKQIPVLEIDANIVGGNEIVSNVQYQDVPQIDHTGISENTSTNFNAAIFPNPCEDVAVLNYNLSTSSKIKIAITDVLGKTVATIADENETASTYFKTINIKELKLNKGIYFVSIQSNNASEVKKLIVQ